MLRFGRHNRHFLALVLLTSLLFALLPSLAQDTSAMTPFGSAGPYAVGYRQFVLDDSDVPRTGAIWYPAVLPDGVEAAITYDFGVGDFVPPPMNLLEGHALLDAEPFVGDAPYPLVVSSHGRTFSYYVSAYQFEQLASHGFVVFAFDHSRDKFSDLFTLNDVQMVEGTIDSLAMRLVDITMAIDTVETMTSAEGILTGLVDMERIGVHGLSYGGYTAVMETGIRLDFTGAEAVCAETEVFSGVTEPVCMVYGEDMAALNAHLAEIIEANLVDGRLPPLADPRVDAAAAIVPGGGLSLIADAGLAAGDKPLLMLVAGNDPNVVLEDNALRVWEQSASSMEAMAIFEGASHMFAGQCTPGMLANWPICAEPVWDAALAQTLSNHFVTAFFRATLMGDTAAAAALAPDAVDFEDITYQSRGF